MNNTLQCANIKKIPLFSGLPERDLLRISENSSIKSFRKNTIVIHEDDLAHSLYFVLHGAVRVYSENTRGKEVTLNELSVGDMFGELAWLSHSKRTASVITKQHTKLLVIQSSEFEKLYLAYPEISKVIVSKYANQISSLTQHLETVTLENIREKVFWAIKNYAKKSQNDVWVTSVTHKELACLIGSSRESVSRAIQELKQSGQISVENGFLYLNYH